VSPAAPSATPSVAEREVRLTTWLVVAALGAGTVLQTWIPPGGVTLVAGAFLASVVVFGLSFVVPGRLRETLAGFRFIATLLFVLAVMAVLGTLILQMKPAGFYAARYGFVGRLIVGLRFDDIFHGLPFALLMALFGSSVFASATLRWPVKVRNAGFFICHVGLLTSLAGAAASATLAIRGRIDLFAGGETAQKVRVTRAGQPTGELALLGFDLHLDRFQLVNYETEYRVGYYEQRLVPDENGVPRQQWKLKASFDPDGEKHRLPGGDSFQVKGLYPDFRPVPDPANNRVVYGTASKEWNNPAIAVEVNATGVQRDNLMFAGKPSPVFLGPDRALVFERRDKEAKQYVSYVSALQGSGKVERSISVNDPMTFAGWTLYQVNYNPNDPTYSGLEAVYDPGVAWVFAGFALICLGVFYMFYVEPRLKKGAKAAAAA
jgi:hypothetical protein